MMLVSIVMIVIIAQVGIGEPDSIVRSSYYWPTMPAWAVVCWHREWYVEQITKACRRIAKWL